MKAILKALLPGLVLLAAVSCRDTVVIVSTNDIHAEIDNFPRLATLVEDLRAKYPGKVLLVDAGDRWSGNPYVDMAESPGKPIVDLMNELRYDVATYGNHEWNFGIYVLADRMRYADFSLVLANADLSQTRMPATPPYVYKKIDGLKIAFLGLVTTAADGHPAGRPENFGAAAFSDPLQTAEQYKALADSCGLYVVVSHIGFEQDSLLAARQPGIDLIIGGDSHTALPRGRKINRTLVTQTGDRLGYAGVTIVKHRKGEVKRIKNRLVKLADVAPSFFYESIVEKQKKSLGLEKKVGSTAAPFGKIALMNLFSDIVRQGSSADFAFYNMGGMRLEELPAGDISRADLLSAEPFNNRPEIFIMTLDDIKGLILNKFNSEGKESHTLDLYPSGMTYTIITDASGAGRDVIFRFKPMPSRGGRYVVALSDYVAAVYKYTAQSTGTPKALLITEMAANYMGVRSPLQPDDKNRVVIK